MTLGFVLLVTASAQAQLTIMPLGDSLTWGYDGGPDTPQYLSSLDTGGYRSPLYSALVGDNINVNYVGTDTGNPSPTLTAAGQTAHNGFNSFTINQIDGNLSASQPASNGISNDGGYWLTGGGGTGRGPETADVILLQIGANDLVSGVDPNFVGPGPETDAQVAADAALRLQTLINDIRTLEPNATLLVDGTSPLLNGAAYTTRSQDYDVDVQNLVLNSYHGDQVYYVNMWNAIYSGALPGYLYFENDGVHLNTLGYDAMAQAWYQAIISDVNFQEYQAVPEPSTVGLFLVGALGLFGVQRLRNKRA